MNDVAFVTVNSKLGKKKEARKEASYDIDDACSNDDWIVEEDENNDDLEEDIVVGEEAIRDARSKHVVEDDLDLPSASDEDCGDSDADLERSDCD